MKALTTKVPSDLMDKIDQHADERDISRSHAARDLLYEGLESVENPGPDPFKERLARATIVALILGHASLSAAIGNYQIAVLYVGAFFFGLLFEPQIFSTTTYFKKTLSKLYPN